MIYTFKRVIDLTNFPKGAIFMEKHKPVEKEKSYLLIKEISLVAPQFFIYGQTTYDLIRVIRKGGTIELYLGNWNDGTYSKTY